LRRTAQDCGNDDRDSADAKGHEGAAAQRAATTREAEVAIGEPL
jgi:hypothetical protein